MNAVIYPVYFHRNFERRWATRMAEAEPRRLRREGTDTCECGNVVGVPRSFGHLPIGITHEIAADRELILLAGNPSGGISMTLQFPNHSRSYDRTRQAVRFWGYDTSIEYSFFVTVDALQRVEPHLRRDEEAFSARSMPIVI